ncbi:MAG: (d)CMP kinase [Bacteroidales bacterium]|nr:(d)CMP kinase [Bacteroidales bacterium]
MPDITIAIDGYSSTGKSSFAKLVSRELGFLYLDSGALYRGVTLFCMENGWISAAGEVDGMLLRPALKGLDLHFGKEIPGHLYMGEREIEKEIRLMEVSSHVIPVFALAFVREYVDEILHREGNGGRVVMDGRDIGTTVFPNAELKIFMTADPLVRARRRAAELEAKGMPSTIEEVLENLKERDYMDSHRAVSPLKQAQDAVVLDNSDMTFQQQMQWLLDLIASRWGNSR